MLFLCTFVRVSRIPKISKKEATSAPGLTVVNGSFFEDSIFRPLRPPGPSSLLGTSFPERRRQKHVKSPVLIPVSQTPAVKRDVLSITLDIEDSQDICEGDNFVAEATVDDVESSHFVNRYVLVLKKKNSPNKLEEHRILFFKKTINMIDFLDMFMLR